MSKLLGVVPEQVDLSRWPKNSLGDSRSFDCLVIMLPKPLAGLGTSRQLDCLCDAVQSWPEVRSVYVGPRMAFGATLLREPYEDIPVSSSIPSTYQQCTTALTNALRRLLASGVRRPVVVSMGYTAFGPEAAKRAYRTLHPEGLEAVRVLILDSAFPDRDLPEESKDDDGWPLTRFHEPSYEPEIGVEVAFLLTSAYPYEPRALADRVPPVEAVQIVAPPYTDAYLERLSEAADRGRVGGHVLLAKRWPELQGWRDGDLLVPLVSSDIWSPSSVGVWMKEWEYASVVDGTRMLLDGLRLAAHNRNCRIFVPVDAAIAAVTPLVSNDSTADTPISSGVVLLQYTGLTQQEHTEVLGASDLAISRTGGQSNASVVLAFAHIPTIILDLPAVGYMQSEITSAATEYDFLVAANGKVSTLHLEMPLAYFARWNLQIADFARLLEEVLSDPVGAMERAESALSAFEILRSSPEGNLLNVLRRLFRVEGSTGRGVPEDA